MLSFFRFVSNIILLHVTCEEKNQISSTLAISQRTKEEEKKMIQENMCMRTILSGLKAFF